MSNPFRKLQGAKRGSAQPIRSTQVCTVTGVTIPECSCRRCVDELIRHHSPLLLNRRFGNGSSDRRAA